ncbi:hypothetical protein HS088_TW22G01515 [Tripterygium wilfordii]|uniref:Zinc finger Mcm10/DnaG-type domain-containing protein n=1 Tax=Tripterygium wilfordii TaxID=458696 RepID=A0A7J7C139_TRIWF|nr:protein MCM10 homolog [Tripterygium wilfordii]XP_038694437.1 protein MCM10 homolog [Tripterygium wilfordii]XP_038694438.1 protein MCM10 homolog [Tripterygium wilfordii]KAF5727818.1 hypothetical protein HS088_TW22G01515 [Tripterygium wilfordii]
MSTHQEDLDLLLSLQDRVLETPPGSPGYLSDDGSPRRRGPTDMSVFRDAVQDCLDYEPKTVENAGKSNVSNKKSDAVVVEKFSGLRIRNQLVSPSELGMRFSDIRFARLSTIKNLLVGDTLSGCWASVGVLTEKGSPKTSSVGKNYCVWKIGCLDENAVSLFLFGDAYQQNCKEKAGTVFALFNCTVRKDAMGTGFSLSIYSPSQILKMGTSVDYGVCKGKRKDGMSCSLVINKRQGIYCKYHRVKSADKYFTTRTELKGGNLRTAFRDPLKAKGIYLVDPLGEKTNVRKPVKLLSVEGLKKALSNAGKVTTNTHSQGIRFLSELTGKMAQQTNKVSIPDKQRSSLDKRKSSSISSSANVVRKDQSHAKRNKTDQEALAEKKELGKGKMIELDFVSSDEEI